MLNTAPAASSARVSQARTTTVSVLVSLAGSLLGTWVTGQFDGSPEIQLAGAVLGALVPAVLGELRTSGETRLTVALAVALVAIALTYASFTAAAYVTESPSTFPLPPGVPPPTGEVIDRNGELAIKITPARLECSSDGCSEQVRVENAGDLPLRVDAIEVEGADKESFEPDREGTCAHHTLQESGDNCSFDVRFEPSGDGGTATATLVINQNLPVVPSYVPLFGDNGDGREIPDVMGQEEATAERELQAAGFTNISRDEVDSDRSAGTVVATDPGPGTRAATDGKITLHISKGAKPTKVPVPDVVGHREAAAERELRAAGFTVTVREDPRGNPGDDRVALSTNPAAGVKAAAGSQVTLTVGVKP
jgi:PASTA domain